MWPRDKGGVMIDRAAPAKFEILQQLLHLARQQREALEQDALDRFQRLLDEREDLISRLQTIAADPSQLPDNIVAFPGSADAAGEDELALDTVIRGILDHDRHNEVLLAGKMDEIRQQLPALNRGQQAVAGYRLESSPTSYLDLRS